MSDLLEKSVAGLLDSLADLFETRALIAARRSTLVQANLNVGETRGRRLAYEEAARETRQLAEKLRE